MSGDRVIGRATQPRRAGSLKRDRAHCNIVGIEDDDEDDYRRRDSFTNKCDETLCADAVSNACRCNTFVDDNDANWYYIYIVTNKKSTRRRRISRLRDGAAAGTLGNDTKRDYHSSHQL